ncbi:MAG: hypothetical protein ACRDRX_27235 [Pseudonocardiaceae bacterium]
MAAHPEAVAFAQAWADHNLDESALALWAGRARRCPARPGER